MKKALARVHEGEEESRKQQDSLLAAIREKEEAMTREKVLRKKLDEGSASAAAELKMFRESTKNLKQAVDTLGREKAALKRYMAAASIRHSEEADCLRISRKFEVTHERIRVMIAMIAKAEKCFHRIFLRETQRDKYDDARCMYIQAFGTRKCLEQLKESRFEIPQETIALFSEQEERFKREATRLDV